MKNDKCKLDENIINDIKEIANIASGASSVIFRDTTPKNVILGMKNLYFGNFISKRERTDTIRDMIITGELNEKTIQESLFDFTK